MDGLFCELSCSVAFSVFFLSILYTTGVHWGHPLFDSAILWLYFLFAYKKGGFFNYNRILQINSDFQMIIECHDSDSDYMYTKLRDF